MWEVALGLKVYELSQNNDSFGQKLRDSWDSSSRI
jgi:hypothetical protein